MKCVIKGERERDLLEGNTLMLRLTKNVSYCFVSDDSPTHWSETATNIEDRKTMMKNGSVVQVTVACVTYLGSVQEGEGLGARGGRVVAALASARRALVGGDILGNSH